MLVKDRMSRPALTVHPDMPVPAALKRMHAERIRRFPVVDRHGKLVGIVSERDLLKASPSPATSLSVWEIHYLMEQLTVEKVMTREVLVVSEDTPVDEAARIMLEYKIGGLPVLRDGQVVGMITESDLFKAFLDLLGTREKGVRLTVQLAPGNDHLAAFTCAICKAGGTILAMGTFLDENCEKRLVTVKVGGLSAQKLIEAAYPTLVQVLDVRGDPAFAAQPAAAQRALVGAEH